MADYAADAAALLDRIGGSAREWSV